MAILTVLAGCDDNDHNGGLKPEPEPEQEHDTLPGRLDVEIIRGTVEDIEGNVYGTVVIGNQEWMAENLRVTKYNDASLIDYPGEDKNLWITNNAGAYAWYNNDITNKELHGAVYNWYAVVNDNRLCPEGWRVPDDVDWTDLFDYLRQEYSLPNDKGNVESLGNRLKSCRQENSPLVTGFGTLEYPRWNEHEIHYGFDDFGFSALPVGSRNSEGRFISSPGIFGHWWSITGINAEEASAQYITFDNGAVFRATSKKINGYAVRCLKNRGITTSPKCFLSVCKGAYTVIKM